MFAEIGFDFTQPFWTKLLKQITLRNSDDDKARMWLKICWLNINRWLNDLPNEPQNLKVQIIMMNHITLRE